MLSVSFRTAFSVTFAVVLVRKKNLGPQFLRRRACSDLLFSASRDFNCEFPPSLQGPMSNSELESTIPDGISGTACSADFTKLNRSLSASLSDD